MDAFSYLLGKKSTGGGGSLSEYFTNEIGLSGAGSIIKKIPENITLPSKLTTLRGFFYGWENITTIPALNTSNITNMSWTFEECLNLKTIPEIDTSNVTVFEGMFYNCENLENIPQFDGSGVVGGSSELLQHMFEGCSSLSNESLRNILKFLLSCVNYTSSDSLRFIGLNQTQANYCRTLSEWTTLESQGWTTGY